MGTKYDSPDNMIIGKGFVAYQNKWSLNKIFLSNTYCKNYKKMHSFISNYNKLFDFILYVINTKLLRNMKKNH